MRQIRQTLHLHYQAGLSYAQAARALAQTLTDEELEARLYQPPVPRASSRLEPDFALVHQELKRSGVTLMLLWEEYQRRLVDAGEPAYKYTSFCV